MENDVLGHDARLQFALETKVHRFRHFEQQLPRAHDEGGVGVADAGGEFIEGARHAGVGIGPEKDFAGAGVALLRQGGVANAGVMGAVLAPEHAFGGVELPRPVGIVNDVVEIRDVLFAREVAQNINVAIGFGVRR